MFNSTWQGYNALDTRFVRASAMWFSDLRTLATLNFVNPDIRDCASFKYFYIQPF